MPGHSRGHTLIAVDTGRGWLVHGGDAYFHRSVTERGDVSGMPWALSGVERFIAFDYERVRANHAMLAALAKRDDVTVFSSHDPVEYEEATPRWERPGARPCLARGRARRRSWLTHAVRDVLYLCDVCEATAGQRACGGESFGSEQRARRRRFFALRPENAIPNLSAGQKDRS